MSGRDVRVRVDTGAIPPVLCGLAHADPACRRPIRARSRSRSSCAKCRSPTIEDDEVLLQVGAVSVCGSDVHQSRNTQSWPVEMPVVLGHEFGGTVARAGRPVRGFREGDRVVSETAARICGDCLMCRSGRYNLCPSRKGFGYGIDGAMAQYVRVAARCLHHVPDSLPFDIACLAEPHAVAYNAMCVNSTIRPGDTVVVLGPARSACSARGWRRSPARTR